MKGSILQRGDTWAVYWSTVDPATGKRRQHSKWGFKRKEPARPPKGDSAREFLNEVLAKVQAGEWRQDAKVTVSDLLEQWLAAKSSEGLRAGTTAMYRNVVAGWLVPHIGGLRVEQLSPKVAAELVTTLRSPTGSRLGRGALSDRSVQLAITTLKAATAWAARPGGEIGRDVLAGFKRPRIAPSERAASAWNAEEASAFLRSIESDRLRAAWWLFLSRGLRRGELAGLRWADVDLDGGFLRVTVTRVMVASQATESAPKTNAGRRRVELDEMLVAELRAHRKRQLEERMAAGPAWVDSGFVFVDELGAPMVPQTISRKWDAAIRRAGVRRIRLHDSRHSAATLLLEDGTPVHVVSKMLGHSRASITLDVYAHAIEGAGAEAGGRLTQRLASAGR